MSRSPKYYAYINSKRWREKSRKIQALTKNRCVIFFWTKSQHCHHLTYKNFQSELAIRDCVPFSKQAHSIIHCWILWKTPLRPLINAILRILMIFWIIVRR